MPFVVTHKKLIKNFKKIITHNVYLCVMYKKLCVTINLDFNISLTNVLRCKKKITMEPK
jgi:hypothetical protein